MIRDIGMLVARSTIGLAFASHGAQKAFGAFDGPGPAKAAGFMESLRFKPGSTYATAAASTELVAGIALALGAGGPIAPTAIVSVMIVAAQSVHAKNGFFAQKGGVELCVLYGAAALAVATGGYGRLSIDAVLGLDEPLDDGVLTAAAMLGATIAAVALLARREAPQTPE